jgi:hypothetical protein
MSWAGHQGENTPKGDNRESVLKRTDKRFEDAYYKLAVRTKAKARCVTSAAKKGFL